MEALESWIEEMKGRYGNKPFFNFQETMEITGLKKDALYDLLAEGHLLAHNPKQAPSGKGTRIISCSVWDYIRKGVIPSEKFAE
jgi:predicted DNA-binding transcriptional regulator AlpA